jgi:serine/threonine protein kinase/tetratricopeptide (TPR) repeat protein
MHDSAPVEETLFMRARQFPHPAERAAYLEQACGGDGALRERVERMLTAEQNADRFLATGPLRIGRALAQPATPPETAGASIGPYKLLQQIGEGGCGVVFMAEQEQPIRRRVALKVIKPGMDTRQVVARFEAERQALAMMDHPNIARVLDAGATEGGRPYFVMELVRGTRITDYCDHHNLSTRERLDLFTQVVHAVQHAHQKGVIHRDLKPSNILVTLHDDVPVPKVIDFGIAKALDQKLTDKTLFTQFEQFIGTPAYTSPEQAGMSGLDIDTRSDIYSLGVLLYELLVGKTPFDTRDLVESGLDEMRRIIREREPAPPSTRLSTMVPGEVSTTAQRRRASAPELIHQLRGDLDWIVMKCLEKDRTRRYDTATGLAGDIQHYLTNEPVTARPPSRLYRLGKLVRRNTMAVAAGAAVTFALVAGTLISTWLAVRAQRAEKVSKEEKESTEAVLKFVRDRILAAGRPAGSGNGYDRALGLGKDVTLRQAIEAAEVDIGNDFQNRPQVEAAIRHTLGETYQYLGEPERAARHFERELMLRRRETDSLSRDTSMAMYRLAHAHREAGNWSQAQPLFEEVIKLATRRLETDKSEPRWKLLHGLAASYGAMGRFDQAIPLYEESLKLERAEFGPDHPPALWAMHYLAETYKETGKLDRALPLYEEVLRLRKARLGPTHPDTFWAMHYLAVGYAEAGRRDQALALTQEALQLRKATLGADHADTLWSMLTLAFRYADAGRLEDAVPLHEEVIRLRRKVLGPDHPQTITAIKELALTYFFARKFDLALPLYEQVFELWKTKHGPDHPDALEALHDIAVAYWESGRIQQALPRLEEVTNLRKTQLGTGHPRTLWGMNRLARLYRDAGMNDRAVSLFEETLRLRKAELGPGHRDTDETLYDLAELRYRQRQYAQAEPHYREMLQNRRARLGAEHDDVIWVACGLGRVLADWAWAERESIPVVQNPRPEPAQRAREAEALLRECLEVRQRGTNATDWLVADLKSRLSGALVSVVAVDRTLNAAAREARLAAAEPLLLEGNRGLQESTSADRRLKRDALERLVRLYETWGKPDPRMDWQKQLDAFGEPETHAGTTEQGGSSGPKPPGS